MGSAAETKWDKALEKAKAAHRRSWFTLCCTQPPASRHPSGLGFFWRGRIWISALIEAALRRLFVPGMSRGIFTFGSSNGFPSKIDQQQRFPVQWYFEHIPVTWWAACGLIWQDYIMPVRQEAKLAQIWDRFDKWPLSHQLHITSWLRYNYTMKWEPKP